MTRIVLSIFICLVGLVHSLPVFAQASVPGRGGYYSTCGNYVEYYGSTPQIVEAACVALYNTQPSNAGYTYTFTGCVTNVSCQYAWVHGSSHGTGGEAVQLSTIPAGADCTSGLYDGIAGACIGGTQTCPSGVNQSLIFMSCLGSNLSPPLNNVAICSSYIAGVPPSFASYQGCEYQINSGVGAPPVGWASVADGNGYAMYNYTSDGLLASASDLPSDTAPAASRSNACPSTGPCSTTPLGTGSDGTTGGIGTVACGGTGHPPCANGATSGTTACGGSGQVACASSSTSGDGSAPVCGGPGLPACAVTDTANAPVCGGPGLPVCKTDAAPVCGGPGQPACVSTDVQAESDLQTIRQALTTAGDTPGDPVSSTVADLNAAGLNGGSTFAALTSWTLPSHSHVCPVPTFSLFGSTVTMDSLCTVADSLSALRAVMIAVFTLSALFIVLKA